MAISGTTETAILSLVFNATAWANYADNAVTSAQANVAVALHSADPGTSGTMSTSEIGYGSYARASVVRTSSGWTISGTGPASCSPVSNISFPAGSGGSGTVTNFSTGKTGGGATAILWSGTVTPNIATGFWDYASPDDGNDYHAFVMLTEAYRQCLVNLDVAGIRLLCAQTNSPQPKDDSDALASLHYARTQANSIKLKLRAYSHRWLLDNGLPSGLPDELKPRAEQICPRVVEAVGVSVKAFSEAMAPVARAMERAMSDVVAEMYADGDKRQDVMRARMHEARMAILKS